MSSTGLFMACLLAFLATTNAGNPKTKYLGCYSDGPKRAFPNYMKGFYGKDDCFAVADKSRLEYFGIQNGGECWLDESQQNKYNTYGESDKCNGEKGGSWANSVFKIIYPVDGGWSEFSGWGECSKKCGSGIKRRTRTCTNPKPAHGGKKCEGSSVQTRPCQVKACPVNGGWSGFGGWSNCNKPCGGGTQWRSRSCTNPKPAHMGKKCVGDDRELRRCNGQKCPCRDSHGWCWTKWPVCWLHVNIQRECPKTCGKCH